MALGLAYGINPLDLLNADNQLVNTLIEAGVKRWETIRSGVVPNDGKLREETEILKFLRERDRGNV